MGVASIVRSPPCHSEPFAICHSERSEESLAAQDKLREASLLAQYELREESQYGRPFTSFRVTMMRYPSWAERGICCRSGWQTGTVATGCGSRAKKGERLAALVRGGGGFGGYLLQDSLGGCPYPLVEAVQVCGEDSPVEKASKVRVQVRFAGTQGHQLH